MLNFVWTATACPSSGAKTFTCAEFLVGLNISVMKLAEYLEFNGIKRGEFAQSIGVTGGWITALCDGTGWPSREVAEKIAVATAGDVTANDFLRLADSEELRA